MADFSFEDEYDAPVFGVDEVGRGPLAGPVVAACVFIPPEIRRHPFISDVKDSKKLSKPKLKILNGLIHEYCTVEIAEHSPVEIDEMNILQASLSAMKKACNQMNRLSPKCILIDGNKIPEGLENGQAVVKGDSISKSIAAASIVAKFHRDAIMEKLHKDFPQYGWNNNVGYPTAQHRDAIIQHGITIHHRRSFGPVKKYLEENPIP